MNIFAKTRVKTPGTSTFDLSHDIKISLKMGELVPILRQEAVAGDTFRMSSASLQRLMPMVAPIMHKVDVFTHYFFVPHRILWDGWEDFLTGGEEVGTVPRVMPQMLPCTAGTGIEASSLANYLGLPVNTTLAVFNREVSALPFAAYQRIWWEYYRDQNLQVEAVYPKIDLVDGTQGNPESVELRTLRRRNWEHDYFTAALPYAQKGGAVEIPLQLTGLELEASTTGIGTGAQPQIRLSSTGGVVAGPAGLQVDALGNFDTNNLDVYYDPKNTISVNSDDASTLTTINDLRVATTLQKWLEKNMRAGTRYMEYLLSQFNARPRDERLQRPEYLGGSKSTVDVSEVLQTSSTDVGTTAQGNMAGHGLSVNAGGDFTYKCVEHGYIIGLMSVMPKTAYYSGVPRDFIKEDRFDFLTPDFAHLGEQEVKQIEICYQGSADDDTTFGYLPRYMEYRTNPSRVAGQMATTLEHWHMARKFEMGAPVPLNDEFITCVPDNRIFAVDDPDNDVIVAHLFQNIEANRPLPYYGEPGGL